MTLNPRDLAVRGLEELIDYQEYPVKRRESLHSIVGHWVSDTSV